jgi:hypothetical protein
MCVDRLCVVDHFVCRDIINSVFLMGGFNVATYIFAFLWMWLGGFCRIMKFKKLPSFFRLID